MTVPTVVAVDGGASKTDLAVVAADGTLLAAARGPGSNPHIVGVDGCVAVIADLYDEAVTAARAAGTAVEPRHGTYLLAGADLPDEERELERVIGAHGWTATCRVRNDTFAVLRSGTDRGWGVAIVCGAGINALGVGPDGREVRYPALGALSGDWGGGLELGVAAVGAANRAEDGRGPDTVLAETVPAYFGMAAPSTVAVAVHRGVMAEARLVELAPLVLAAETAGDAVATALVDRLAREVVDFVAATVRRLDLDATQGPIDVVLGGGLLQAGHPRLDHAVDAGITAVAAGARVIRTGSPPIVGAVLLALDELGTAAAADATLRAAFAGRTGTGELQTTGATDG